MGRLVYAQTRSIEFDDRVLAHLQLVITSKLRRGESLTMSWTNTADSASARSTVWLHPAIPLEFDFEGRDTPRINREWLQELAAAANSAQGLLLSGDPGAERDGIAET